MQVMPTKIELYFPMLDNNGASLEEVHKEFQHTLCQDFGGYTKISGRGGWINSNGKVYEEPVFVYTVYRQSGPWDRNTEDAVRAYCYWFGAQAKQEAVMFAINGIAHVLTMEGEGVRS